MGLEIQKVWQIATASAGILICVGFFLLFRFGIRRSGRGRRAGVIDEMEGHDFEYFCAELLKKNGFLNVAVTNGSSDQGVDIIAEKEGIRYGIQCKCYSSDIGNRAVQEVYAGRTFYKCHVGVVLTNRYFTNSAKKLAQSNGIILWDRDKLISLVNSGKGKNI